VTNLDPVARELIELERQMEPLKARMEELKAQIREGGAKTYNLPGWGTVKVTEPGVPHLKGVELKFSKEAFDHLSRKEQAALQAKGVVHLDNVYTKATAARVEIKPTSAPAALAA
jgi:hypothetical protein